MVNHPQQGARIHTKQHRHQHQDHHTDATAAHGDCGPRPSTAPILYL
ncbi:MAG: hypothetical protein R2856_13480 [Caldilineaceae bacterium]